MHRINDAQAMCAMEGLTWGRTAGNLIGGTVADGQPALVAYDNIGSKNRVDWGSAAIW